MMTVSPRIVIITLITCAGLWACQGSELRAPIDQLDVSADTTVDTTPPTDTTTEVDVGDTSLRWWFLTDTGALCVDGSSCELFADDQPAHYADIPGFQIDVDVELRGVPVGTEVVLTLGASVAARGLAVPGGGGTTGVRLVNVTIPDAGTVVATVATTDGTGAAINESKIVTTSFGACDIELVVPTGDAGCALLSAVGDASGVLVGVRHASGACDLATLSYAFDGGDPVELPEAAIEDGEAAFFVPLGAIGATLEGSLDLTGRVLHPARPVLGAEASATVTVDNAPPAVTITFPDPAQGPITLAHDEDEDPTNGIQLSVAGETDLGADATDALALFVDGQLFGTTSPEGDGTFVFPPVTLTVDGVVEFRVVATDACGNQGDASVELPVQLTPGELAIVSPSPGVLLAVDDGDPQTDDVYELTIGVRVADAPEGAEIAVECASESDPEAWTVVASVIVGAVPDPPDSVYEVDATLALADFGAEVWCRATVDLPNPGSSAVVSWVLAIPAPTLGPLDAPAAGECLATTMWTVSGSAVGLEGQPVTVDVVTSGGDVAATSTSVEVVAAGAYETTIGVGGLADGPYTVRVDARDALGNLVSDTSERPTAAVLLDRTAPEVAILSPTGVLDPASEPEHADEDGDPDNGYQTTVTVALSDANAIGGEACLTVNGDPLGCQAVVAADGIVSWSGVTLLTGPNELSVTGQDACGNPAAEVSATVTLVLDLPVVTIIVPDADLTTVAETVDVTVRVTTAGGQPVGGLNGDVELRRDGVSLGLVPASPVPADGTYTFEAVGLLPGANAFTAAATVAGGTGVSAVRTVTRKVDLPGIAITVPPDGAVLNLASGACAQGSVDCVLAVLATTTDAEDGSVATLEVTCAGADEPVISDALVESGAVTWPGVVLAHGTSCDLVPSVVDAFGQGATGATISVAIDRVAPVLSITSPAGSQLVFSDDEAPGTPGIQHRLTVDVAAGIEAGRTITATVAKTQPGGGLTTEVYTHQVTVDTPEGEVYTADFGVLTWTDGSYAISVQGSDAAGNAATPASRTVQVQEEPALVRISGPAFAGDAFCDASTPCASGTCNFADNRCYSRWGIETIKRINVEASGLQTSADNLRVCSTWPGLAGAGAPQCTSTVGGATTWELRRVSTTGGVISVELDGFIPEGFQTVVAEIFPFAGGVWLSSVNSSVANARYRRLLADFTRPTVSSVMSPSDTEPPEGVLNIAEQEAPGRVYAIRFHTDEAGSAAVYVNSSAAPVTTLSVPAGETTVNVPLAEGSNNVWVVVTDIVGNRSFAPPNPAAVVYSVVVDTTPPTVSFVRPSSSPLKMGDNLDVDVSCGEDGQPIEIRDAGDLVASGTCEAGGASFPHADFGILSNGSHTLTATHVDAAGNPTTVGTDPATIVVDTAPPSGTILSPADQTIFTDEDDASEDPGYQIAVTFSTDDGATRWRLWLARNCDATFEGCDPPTLRANGDVTNPGGPEPSQLLTINIDQPTSFRRLILETEDAVGNTAMTEVRLTFIITECSLNFDDVPESDWYNASYCADGPSCPSATVSVDVRLVGICPGVDEVRLLDGATQIGAVAPSNGLATFVITLADGAALALEGRAFSGEQQLASTGVRNVGVDLQPPDVQFVAELVSGFQTVAEGGEVVWNRSQDLAPGSPGFQFHARVRISDANVQGGQIQSVVAVGDGAVTLTPSNVTLPLTLSGASPVFQNLLSMTLGDLQTHVVTVTARDAAGNVSTSSFTATVDITPPAPVEITGFTVLDKRRPHLRVSFVAVGDNGMTGGPVASYDFRYSRSPITEANFDSACSARHPELYLSPGAQAPAAPGTARTAAFRGPDARPFSDDCKVDPTFEDGSPPSAVAWYVALRAEDAAGNRSAVTSNSVGTFSYADVALESARIRFAPDTVFGPAGATAVWTVRGAVVGDVNGDGRADIVVGSEFVGGFCLIFGGNHPKDLVLDTVEGPFHRCLLSASFLTAPGGPFAGASLRDFALHLRGVGDVNGDGFADFLVTGKFAQGNEYTGEAFFLVYLGGPNGPDLQFPNLIVRGIQHVPSAAYMMSACGIGDFDGVAVGGLVTDDLAIGEPGFNKIHVLPGDPSWTQDDQVVIDLLFDPTYQNEPDDLQVRVDHNMLTFRGLFAPFVLNPAPGSPSPGLFGMGCSAAGDVLPTPAGGGAGDKGDLLVHQSGSADARLFVFPGREYAPGAEVAVTQNVNDPLFGTPEDLISVRLRQEVANIRAGFGINTVTRVDLTGDRFPDILTGCRARSLDVDGGDGRSVYIFDGSKLAGLVGTDVRVGAHTQYQRGWIGTNGYVLEVSVNAEPGSMAHLGNFDTVALGSPPFPSIDLVFGNSDASLLEVRYFNHYFTGQRGAYPVQDGEIGNVYTPGGGFSAGIWVGAGDVSGSSATDIVTGSVGGGVLIIR